MSNVHSPAPPGDTSRCRDEGPSAALRNTRENGSDDSRGQPLLGLNSDRPRGDNGIVMMRQTWSSAGGHRLERPVDGAATAAERPWPSESDVTPGRLSTMQHSPLNQIPSRVGVAPALEQPGSQLVGTGAPGLTFHESVLRYFCMAIAGLVMITAALVLGEQVVHDEEHPIERFYHEPMQVSPRVDFVAVVFNSLVVNSSSCHQCGIAYLCCPDVNPPPYDFAFANPTGTGMGAYTGATGSVVRPVEVVWDWFTGGCNAGPTAVDFCPTGPTAPGNFSVAWGHFAYPFLHHYVKNTMAVQLQSELTEKFQCEERADPVRLGPTKGFGQCVGSGWNGAFPIKQKPNGSTPWPFQRKPDSKDQPRDPDEIFGWPNETFFLIPFIAGTTANVSSVYTKIREAVAPCDKMTQCSGHWLPVGSFEGLDLIAELRSSLQRAFPEGTFVNFDGHGFEKTIRLTETRKDCAKGSFLMEWLYGLMHNACEQDVVVKSAVELHPAFEGTLAGVLRDTPLLTAKGPRVDFAPNIEVTTVVRGMTWLNWAAQMLSIALTCRGVVYYVFPTTNPPIAVWFRWRGTLSNERRRHCLNINPNDLREGINA